MNKKLISIVVASIGLMSLAACSDASVVSENLSKEADNFSVARRIVLYNGITDAYIQTVVGFCSLQPSSLASISVVCKTPAGYVKHLWALGDNVTVFAEQLADVNVSSDFYQVNFKPLSIIPDFKLR